MSNQHKSIFEALVHQNYVDSHTRTVAGTRVKHFFMELLYKYGIEDIHDEDIEELAFDLIDDLCIENFTCNFN